jgi:predicted DNA-binding transcriptional regulator
MLEVLDLTDAQARCYESLVGDAARTAADLAAELGLGRQEVDSALSALIARGLVSLGEDGRYVPAPPEVIERASREVAEKIARLRLQGIERRWVDCTCRCAAAAGVAQPAWRLQQLVHWRQLHDEGPWGMLLMTRDDAFTL